MHMRNHLLAGVCALAFGLVAPAHATQITLGGPTGTNSGVLTFTGGGVNTVSLGLTGSYTGFGTFEDATPDPGTYTLSNLNPNPVTTGAVLAGGNFPISVSLDLSWAGTDGDMMTGTATFDLLKDSTLKPDLLSNAVQFNFKVSTSSGDADFMNAFPAGTTREMDLTFILPGPTLDDLAKTTSSEKADISSGEVLVPAPLIDRGFPAILAVGGLLFGVRLWERGKTRFLLGAAGPGRTA